MKIFLWKVNPFYIKNEKNKSQFTILLNNERWSDTRDFFPFGFHTFFSVLVLRIILMEYHYILRVNFLSYVYVFFFLNFFTCLPLSVAHTSNNFISLPCNTLTHTTMTFRFSTWNPYSRIRKILWNILHCIKCIYEFYCHVFHSIPY